MSAITQNLAIPLGILISFCYELTHNYVLAIILFTLLTKVVLFPVALWTHRESLKMVSLMPELNALKVKYYGDKDTIAEETQKLYKKVGYHPLVSTVPMIIQIVLLMGVIDAVKKLLEGTESMLSVYPAQTGGMTLLMPLAAGAAALILGLAQNRLNPLQREQSKGEQLMTNGISVAISLFLGAFVSVGTGVYWIASNLFSILNQLALNAVMPAKKYVDYPTLRESQAKLKEIENLTPKVSKEDRKREKADYKRFFSVANKHIVFYSERSGYYKYLKGTIDELLKRSNVTIHYVTSDPEDQIFAVAEQQPRIRPYYIGEKKLITLFMKMDANIVVMTTPDLDNFYLKRSYVRKDVQYVYIDHGIGSANTTLRERALDHFDTVFCTGPFVVEELTAFSKIRSFPPQELVPVGYPYLDSLITEMESHQLEPGPRKQVLIAPSHQEGNIMDSCVEQLVSGLLGQGYYIIVRPHPQYVRRNPDKMLTLRERFKDLSPEEFLLQTDFSSNDTVYTSDVLISDWSGIAYEFSFSTGRPSLFINTPMKTINPNWKDIDVEPVDLSLRKKLGKSLELNEVDQVGRSVAELIRDPERMKAQIMAVREETLFHVGSAAVEAAGYLIAALQNKQTRAKAKN